MLIYLIDITLTLSITSLHTVNNKLINLDSLFNKFKISLQWYKVRLNNE